MRTGQRPLYAAICILVGVACALGGYQHAKHKMQRRAAAAIGAIERRAMAAAMADIHGLTLALDHSLKVRSGLSLAIALRDLIHRRIPLIRSGHHTEPVNYRYDDLALSYRIALFDPRTAMACGGRVIQYLSALRAFGFRARLVALYSGNEQLTFNFPSHASVDVAIKERWIALDPHFNLSFHDEAGGYLSWDEIIARSKQGLPVVRSSDGYTPLISMDDYLRQVHETMKGMARFVVFGPHSDGQRTIPASTMPASWNGDLRYKDHSTFNALGSAMVAPYPSLARPIIATGPAG